MDRDEIYKLVVEERKRQDSKWGANRDLEDRTWLTILMEEVGEIAHANLERDKENLEEEIIQTIAVCFAWLEGKDGSIS